MFEKTERLWRILNCEIKLHPVIVFKIKRASSIEDECKVKMRDGFGRIEPEAELSKKAHDAINYGFNEPAGTLLLFLEIGQLLIRQGLRIFLFPDIRSPSLLSVMIACPANIC